MNISNNNQKNILDLPNEILFIIFKKLNMVDVLYSLVDVTQRFDQIILNPLYICNLDMTTMTMKSCFEFIYSIDNKVLDRICKTILHRIHHQVNELTVEQHSMERVLHTINYPALHSLSFIDFQEDVLLKYLTDNTALRKLLTEQITSLQIDVMDKKTSPSLPRTLSTIFAFVLSLCKRLIKLSFCHLYHHLTNCTFDLSSTNCLSSTLTTLEITVKTFDDCLYLLDERLNCLSTLKIHVDEIAFTSGTIDNTKILPKLKHFTFWSDPRTLVYDNQILPLFRRMINLEELIFFLSIIRIDSNYIDGIQLYDDILIYMRRLKKFVFNIDTCVIKKNIGIALSSNEDIQRSFIGREYGPVGTHVETFSGENKGRGHMYSLPHEFNGGMFDNVHCLMMTDIRPFEHYFFKVISQSFPLLKRLYIFNNEPQKEKQQPITFIKFSHLILLYLTSAHVDYAKQFLFNKHCHLPCLLDLYIRYESLAVVTNNFTNDGTRRTCDKLTSLHVKEPFVPPENFHQYFPLL
ncbi:unnamed protein product [Rotaria socialis]|uniref:F-box domain-containing protein n=2 Tax=Rotaria socialis TaxID=392032 RepID=A0A820KSS5_9BILA|nr:unnamed protein product [Rotaria socialis]CAF4806866.1 unnamed protein product [Rotaria socialis]